MNLIETTKLGSAALPIVELREYLRLGRGFPDDGAQDTVLESCLRAAMGAIEARTSKALVTRVFQWTLYRYRFDGNAAVLPISPVTWLLSFSITTAEGATTPYARGDYILQQDSQRGRIVAKSGKMPEIPEGGFGSLHFNAGFGAWNKVPSALQHAMLMLAGFYYENRDAMLNGAGQMPLGVASLLAPYQRIRLRSGA